jgi:hypothetical protein
MELLPVFVALGFAVSLLGERLMLRFRVGAYFAAGLSLNPPLAPIPSRPEGSGTTSLVDWEVSGDRVRFWAAPGARRAPMLLHGAVRLRDTEAGVRLDVRWSPPWSPLLALTWLGGLGVARGDGMLMVPVALVLLVVIAVLYRRFAVRAADELRWAWVSGSTSPG